MTPLSWLMLLLAGGIILLILELILPTHGIIGAMGVVALLAAVGVCFRINAWASLGMLVAMVIATPFVWSAAVRIWPKTPVGRRIMLPSVEATSEPMPFQIGQRGVSVGELKPMGECDLGGKRLQARSASGLIAPGTRVLVVSADGRIPTVRPLQSDELKS